MINLSAVLLWNNSEVNKYNSQIIYLYCLVIQKGIRLNIGGNERKFVSSKRV